MCWYVNMHNLWLVGLWTYQFLDISHIDWKQDEKRNKYGSILDKNGISRKQTEKSVSCFRKYENGISQIRKRREENRKQNRSERDFSIRFQPYLHPKQRWQHVSHLVVSAEPRRLCKSSEYFGYVLLVYDWKRQGSTTWPKDKNNEDAAGLSGITNHHCIAFASPPKSRSRSSPYLPSSSPAGGGRKLRCCKPASSRCVHLSAPKHQVLCCPPAAAACRANQ